MCRTCNEAVYCHDCERVFAFFDCYADGEHFPCERCTEIVCFELGRTKGFDKVCKDCQAPACYNCGFEVKSYGPNLEQCNDCRQLASQQAPKKGPTLSGVCFCKGMNRKHVHDPNTCPPF